MTEHASDTRCSLTHSDAAYVLGSLSPTERLDFERHLPGCVTCRRSVAELAGIPGLLSRVSVESVESPAPVDPVPSTLLPALVGQVRREQRRRSVLLSLGAAAAVAALAIGAAALQNSANDHSQASQPPPTSAIPSPAPFQDMDVVVDWGMRAQVSLTPTPAGTSLLVNCTYPKSSGGSHHLYYYKLVAFTADGHSRKIMDWRAGPGQDRRGLSGTTGLALEDMKKVEVQNDEGTPILRLNL
jgi:hypothetical protein